MVLNVGLTRWDACSASETFERTREMVECDDDDVENVIECLNVWLMMWLMMLLFGGGFGDGEDGMAARAAAAAARAFFGGATECDCGKDFGVIECGMFDVFVVGVCVVVVEVLCVVDVLEMRGVDDAADGEDDARRISSRA